MKTLLIAVLAGVATTSFTGSAQAQRMDAEVECRPTGEDYSYHCTIHLMEMPGGEPVENAEFQVRADMPSMPMAHNVPPVAATAADGDGIYEATLELEMQGEWALRLDINAPRRDIVVVVKEFGEDHAQGNGHGSNQGHGHGGH